MTTSVLVVDDSPVDRRLAGGIAEHCLGWDVFYAEDGRSALAALGKRAPDIVLTDLQMPGMNGLELVQAIREASPLLPIVLMTAYGSEDLAIEALRNGATSYVPKRTIETDLVGVLEHVQAKVAARSRQNRLLDALTAASFRYRLDNDPALIAGLVVDLQDYMLKLGVIEEAGKIRVGIALEEALLNALYHGNLQVSSELRENGDAPFHRLAAERRQLAPYRDRRIDVRAEFTIGTAVFTITDEGPGFDPQALPDPTDPENLLKSSGRGIMLIRTFMDEVRYNATGNEVTLVKRAATPEPTEP